MLARAQGLDVAGEAPAGRLKHRRERRVGFGVVAAVRDSERAPCIERKVVRLTWMCDRVIVGQQRAAARERIDVRRLRIADDLVERMIFFNHDHDVIVGWHVVACSHCTIS